MEEAAGSSKYRHKKEDSSDLIMLFPRWTSSNAGTVHDHANCLAEQLLEVAEGPLSFV